MITMVDIGLKATTEGTDISHFYCTNILCVRLESSDPAKM